MRFLLIGPRNGGTPTGVSNAFEMLIEDVVSLEHCSCSVVDMNFEAGISNTGRFGLSKALHILKQSFQVLRCALRADRAYLVISSSRLGFLKDFIAIWLCILFRRPIVLHLHGGGYTKFYGEQPRFAQWIIRTTLNQVESVIVLGQLLKEQFHFLSKPDIKIVPNGVATPSSGINFEKGKGRPQKDQPWQFLYLSNLMFSKGYLVVAEAFAELLRDEEIDAVIHFCGNFLHSSIEGSATVAEESKERFLSLVNEPQFKGRIVYHGNADTELKRKMFERCHGFLLPTKYPGEGQPLSILEAMSVGIPTIATRHAGIPEQVQDGENGILVEHGTKDEIKAAVLKLVNPFQTDYEDMSRRSILRFDQSFTKAQHLARMHTVLQLPPAHEVIKPERVAA